MRREDLRVEGGAQLARQGRLEVGKGRALDVLRAELLRLVLLDHDQPVGAFLQRVEFDARFFVYPLDRGLEGGDHLGAMLGDGESRDHNDDAHVGCLPPGHENGWYFSRRGSTGTVSTT